MGRSSANNQQLPSAVVNYFSDQFTVQNNSLYVLYNVRAMCNTLTNVDHGLGILAERLLPKESATVDCRSEIFGVDQVDMTIGLAFRPWRWSRRQKLASSI
jgi:hypothetical protein